MSTYNSKEGPASGGAADEVRQAFAALPFDQKVATLIRIELDMLGDCVDTVVSAASKAADEVASAFNCSPSAAPGQTSAGGQAPTS